MKDKMNDKIMGRKEFLSHIGRTGACTCAAAASAASSRQA
jgi:hypothetical protein